MSKPQRATPAGRAYLDLQKLARTSGRTMQALLSMYVSERWLARLAVSGHKSRFVLKGGVLLAALGQRRPTQDADLLAVRTSNDHDVVIDYVNQIASIGLADGVQFDTSTTKAAAIREGDDYAGVRLTMNAALASAQVKLKLDINFGDPVTPAPQLIALPTLLDGGDLAVLGYPIVTVLAEKICTAIQLGEANTRIRDYVDLFNLTGAHVLAFAQTKLAVRSTAAHRRTVLRPLGDAMGQLAATRAGNYRAYRSELGVDGAHLPADFAVVTQAVAAFADPLLGVLDDDARWDPETRAWH